jgi:hypothetical protein
LVRGQLGRGRCTVGRRRKAAAAGRRRLLELRLLLVLRLVLLLWLLVLLLLLLLLMVWLMRRTKRSGRRRRGRPTGRCRPARENGEGVFPGDRRERETATAAAKLLLLLLVECGVRLLWRRGPARQVGLDVGHARRVLMKLGRQRRSHLLVPLGCCSTKKKNEY